MINRPLPLGIYSAYYNAEFTLTYTEDSLEGDERNALGLAMFMEWSHGAETAQDAWLIPPQIDSSFSVEDLPSNYMGAWLSTKGNDFDSLVSRLRDMCGAVGAEASSEILLNRGENDSMSNTSYFPALWESAECYCDEDKLANRDEAARMFQEYSQSMRHHWGGLEGGAYYISDEILRRRFP